MEPVADPTVPELGGRLSVLTRQKKDHAELDRLLRGLDSAGEAAQGRALLQIHRVVVPHAFAEGAVLRPVMRRVLPDGHELTLRVERELQEVNELVTALGAMAAEDPARDLLLARLVEVLREDVRDEEDVLLPRLQDTLGRGRLRGQGLVWEVLRRAAPTRAHRRVARRPPGNVAVAVPLSVLDRVRDLVDGAVLRGPGHGATVLRTVSTRLGGFAHRVEHLPVLRRGEDPSAGRADH